MPPLPERREKIGDNFVIQRVFGGVESEAQIRGSDVPGHDHIIFDLEPPYRDVLLRHRKARRAKTQLPVVTSPDVLDREKLPETFSLQWDSYGVLEAHAKNPDDVLRSWANRFDFRTEDEQAALPGLRLPQIAALHAISAHFAVGTEFEAATVVLPTGTGKTETMLATQVYRRLRRTFVVVPTDALRQQIADKFINLGVLPDAKVVPAEIAKPRVALISKGIRTVDEAHSLIANANVLVTLPNTLTVCDRQAVDYLAQECSDLFVDEAHHVTASTWQQIRDKFEKKRILQFTATPFRRDRQRIDGKIIFNFKLGDAQAAGYYRPINLRTVEEYGDEEARDYTIANAAVAALKRDREELGNDHLLMARTDNVARAERVLKIYKKLAPEYKPVAIYSGTGRTEINRKAKDRLFDRRSSGSRIVVCVNMLGEGFDLPYLKIAALHDNHKSLAITLQFIGRFTRKGNHEKIGEATVVANIADPNTEEKLAELYAEGADWDKIIKRLSEEKVEKELRLQDVVFGLKQSGDLHSQLSLWNLRPPLSAQLFRTTCTDWTPLAYSSVLPKGAENWHSLDEKTNTLVAVVCRSALVKWGDYQNIHDTIYDLVILRWVKESNSLCVFASDYDALRSEKMAELVSNGTATLVSGPPIFNILNNVELPLVKNLGSSRIGAISFTSYFGPNVTEGLASIEKAESELNNLACLGYENGERVLWGGTQRRGKIWQQKTATIADWIDWTSTTWKKVTTENLEVANIVKDFLRPKKLDAPYDSMPISVQWGEYAQNSSSDQSVLFDETEVPSFMIDLTLDSPEIGQSILIQIASDVFTSKYRLTIEQSLPGGYRHEHVSGPRISYKRGREAILPLEEYLQKDPFIIHYADGTYSYNCYHIPTNLQSGLFDKAKLESWDWSDIPLNAESIGKANDTNTIQYRAFRQVQGEFDVVFNDDGCGEAADLVCLKDIDDNSIQLTLVHCKGAVGSMVSKNIENFYVICGQAQKSIVAKHRGLSALYHDLKRREGKWVTEGKSRFLKGDIKKLSYFKEKARRSGLKFEIIVVQPGASIATVTDDCLRLLGTTELYISKTTQAKLRVIVSP